MYKRHKHKNDFTLNYPLLIIYVSIYGSYYWRLRRRLYVYFSRDELKSYENDFKDDISDEMKDSIVSCFVSN